jgi:group I intron endonuclease
MGAVFALFAGFYYWTPKIVGRNVNDLLGKIHFWTLFIGVSIKGRKIYGKRGALTEQRFNSKLSLPPEGAGENSPLNQEDFVFYFKNVKESKRKIYNELRRKSGVYLFINNINKGLYVGSSINLTKRMTSHFYHANSNKPTNIVINKAFRKYKLENFSLAILELCSSNATLCSDLEQKWIDYYNPNYNVLKFAGSSSGFRHKIDTINKLKEIFTFPLRSSRLFSIWESKWEYKRGEKENHHKFGTITSSETKKAISDGIKNFYMSRNHSYKGYKGKLSPQYGIGGEFVFCYNNKNEELIFPSINSARQHFKVRWTFIKKNIDTQSWVNLQGEDWIILSVPRPPKI